MKRRVLTALYAIAATVTAIVAFSFAAGIVGRVFKADEAPSIASPRGSVLPAPDPPVAPRAPGDAAAREWCRDDEGEANEHVPPPFKVSAKWALESAVRSGIARRFTNLDAGIAAEPWVSCPDLDECDKDCFYWIEFVQLRHGVLDKLGDVAVNARTGEIGATIEGTWTTVPAP